MPSFKLSVDDENVPWLNLTEKLPETETVAVRSCRSQSHNHNYVCTNRHTNTHSYWVIHACWCHHRSSGDTQGSTRGLTSELWTPWPNICLPSVSHQYTFWYFCSVINYIEIANHYCLTSCYIQIFKNDHLMYDRLKSYAFCFVHSLEQCKYFKLKAALFNTCSVKQPTVHCT